MKVSANNLQSEIRRALERAVINGASKTVNDSIMESLTIVEVTGSTFQSFKPIFDVADSSGDKVLGLTIASFNTKAPELLERGIDSPYFPKSPYPIYIPEWVKAKGLDDKFKSGWVTIGNPSTTYWGTKKNKWFTNSIPIAQRAMASKIRTELQKIQ